MALEPPRRVVAPLASPQHFVPPTARELRAQAVQRLQTGLFGLAAILLLIGLANIINDRARLAAAEQTRQTPLATTAPGAAAPKADPLADAGVVPSTVPSARATPPAARPATLPH